MIHLSHSVPVNDKTRPDVPVLTRSQLWRGLVMRAEDAVPFTPEMTSCTVIERTSASEFLREVAFQGHPIRERVTLFPETRVHFEQVSGPTRGTIDTIIEEDTGGELQLRFSFNLDVHGIAPGSDQEKSFIEGVRDTYMHAVELTLERVRDLVRSGALT